MTDLIERLRKHPTMPGDQGSILTDEAADEIERLTADLQYAKDGLTAVTEQRNDLVTENKRLAARNVLLEDVARAADEYTWSLMHGKTAEAMNCYLQALQTALTALKRH